MKDKDIVIKPHPVHNMDPLSIVSLQKCGRKHRKYAGQILELLAEGPANTRTLASHLGCQSGDITKPILDMRKKEVIFKGRRAKDPVTGRPAHFWQLEPPAEGAATATGTTTMPAEDPKDISHTARPQPTKKTKRPKAKGKGKE